MASASQVGEDADDPLPEISGYQPAELVTNTVARAEQTEEMNSISEVISGHLNSEDKGLSCTVSSDLQLTPGKRLLNESLHGPGRSRKRQRRGHVDKRKWKRQISRDNREKGLSYRGFTVKEDKQRHNAERNARVMGNHCNCKISAMQKGSKKSSRLMCRDFSESVRKHIFRDFWKKSWPEKKTFVQSMVDLKCKARERKRVSNSSENSRQRTTSSQFHMKLNNVRERVCRQLFMSTLGLKHRMLMNWIHSNKTDTDHATEQNMESRDEDDGQADIKGAKRAGVIRFLSSLPKLPSHYSRASSEKIYLEPFFRTKVQVFEEYSKWQQDNTEVVKASFTVFFRLFHDLNLALYIPKKDQCDFCMKFEVGGVSMDEKVMHDEEKKQAREEKERDKQLSRDKDAKAAVFTMDTQAVLLCPKMQLCVMYYKMKLQVHNFCFWNLNEVGSNKGTCFVWNESEGGVDAEYFASCVAQVVEQELQSGVKTVILWSDGCGYQNRNAILSNTLYCLAYKYDAVIIQKFLIKGHTQMEVDVMHSLIEKQVSGAKIQLPSDYVRLMERACKKYPFTVHNLTHTFFKKYPTLYHSIRPGKRVGDPCVTNLRALRHAKGTLDFKINFSDPWKPIPLPRTVSLHNPFSTEPVQMHQERLPIASDKYNDLQELCQYLDVDCRDFYLHLPKHTESRRQNKRNAQ